MPSITNYYYNYCVFLEAALEAHYNELLHVIGDIGRDVKPAYTSSKVSIDKLRKSKLDSYCQTSIEGHSYFFQEILSFEEVVLSLEVTIGTFTFGAMHYFWRLFIWSGDSTDSTVLTLSLSRAHRWMCHFQKIL